jgi:uncharacterized repeat protein (TIGR01451 family)
LSLGLLKTASSPEISLLGRLTYTLTVTNTNHFVALHNLVLTDTLPVSAKFTSATIPFTVKGKLVTWQISALDPGRDWTVQLVVQETTDLPVEMQNFSYGVKCDEINGVFTGPPVITRVRYRTYFPLIRK